MRKHRIAFVDDHPVVLAGLAELVGKDERYDVIETGTAAWDALQIARTAVPDLVVMDLNMPGDVLGTIAEIAALGGTVRVLIFTASDRLEDCHAALQAGAMGYVVKGSSGGELFHAIESVLNDRQFVSSAFAVRMLNTIHPPRRAAEPEADLRLSHREDQVISHLMRGASNREIADSLHVSEKTVKYYMTHIMQKLNAKNRLEVVVNMGKRRAV
jgi:two-component system nitrate/nitrite response regulator NarL